MSISCVYCFKIYLAPFSGYKTIFFPQYYAPEYAEVVAEQDQIDAKWVGKQLISRRKCRRVGRSLINVKKSKKETENLNFLLV